VEKKHLVENVYKMGNIYTFFGNFKYREDKEISEFSTITIAYYYCY